jgi:hypothetical protein
MPQYTLEDIADNQISPDELVKKVVVDLAKHVLMLRRLITKGKF